MAAVQPISNEFAGADFNDERLSKRLLKLVNALASEPSRSFPDAALDDAALEATYRFLGNERVSPEAVLAPHVAQTRRRASRRKTVLVVHDTTEFVFRGDREGLGVVTNNAPGFFSHASLAVSADGKRIPLGVLSTGTFIRERRATRSRPRGRTEEELVSFRWWQSVETSSALLGEQVRAVHVMDREADASRLLSRLVKSGERFVIRARFDRQLDTAPPDSGRLRQRLALTEQLIEREVELSPRGTGSRKRIGIRPKNLKTHPPRARRVARLAIGAARIRLKETDRVDGAYVESRGTFEVNAIWVREIDTPEGQAPVDWMLFTSEPIKTPENLEFVVDAYRARWVIEEYFKALKTGCAFESRQLEGKRSLLNALAVFAPLAWRLLLLRSAAHYGEATPATSVVSPLELTILKKRPKSGLPENPTARDVLYEVARLGGHIKNNGEPGWMVLGRGFEKLLLLTEGARLALGEM